MRVTSTEAETMRTLDILCWEDAEAGGGGWTTIRDVAREMVISYVWAAQILAALRIRGLAEARPSDDDRRRLRYALSEDGDRLLHGATAPEADAAALA